MSRQLPLPIAFLAALVALLAGCQPQQPFYFREPDGDLEHWIGTATQIEQADLEDYRSLPDVEGALRPYSLQSNEPKEMWDLPLQEAVRCALINNKIMKAIGGQVTGAPSMPDYIIRNGYNLSIIPTIYDPSIVESDPRSGVEATLAAFDTQFSLSQFWEKNDQPRNTNPITEDFMPSQLQQDLGTFQAQLQKTAATGGTFYLRHNVRYDRENGVLADGDKLNTRTFIGDWNVNLEAEFRQPLLQGAGAQFNRIAGPGATPGAFNGVMLARINEDIALSQFEGSVRNLVSDVENAYWDLYYQYRALDAVIRGRDSALKRWQVVYSHFVVGRIDVAVEAQARQQYFLFREAVEESLTNLYHSEANLRYLIGIAATDGRLIRPSEEPTSAKVVFDWYDILAESLARNVELRQLQWQVKRGELNLIASKNFLLPRLDVVGRYRWLGMGDELINYEKTSNPPTDLVANAGMDPSAYRSMTLGDYQEWQLGLQFQMPIGFRREMAGVRNAQLQLAKERAIMQEGELELSHQMAYALRDLEAKQVICKTNYNSMIAAWQQLKALDILWEAGTTAAKGQTSVAFFSTLLEAQRTLATAESTYYRSLVDYNKAIINVHFRKGSLLEYNGVCLAEGPWPGKAYFDAERRARSRGAGTYMDYGFTLPKVVSRGPIQQHVGSPEIFGRAADPSDGENRHAVDDPPPSELIPAPEPYVGRPAVAPEKMPEEFSLPPNRTEVPNEPDAYSPPAPPAFPTTSRQGIQR